MKISKLDFVSFSIFEICQKEAIYSNAIEKFQSAMNNSNKKDYKKVSLFLLMLSSRARDGHLKCKTGSACQKLYCIFWGNKTKL